MRLDAFASTGEYVESEVAENMILLRGPLILTSVLLLSAAGREPDGPCGLLDPTITCGLTQILGLGPLKFVIPIEAYILLLV